MLLTMRNLGQPIEVSYSCKIETCISLQKHARYGPLDRYEPPPKAGMCLSAFALVRREGKDGVLIGLPKPAGRWLNDWLTSWRVYSKEDLSQAYKEWRLPSCYLRELEAPKDAITRIMNEQLGIARFHISSRARIFSYASPSTWYHGNDHWDLAFAYDVTVGSRAGPGTICRNWWKELRFFGEITDLSRKNFGWNTDFMRDLKIIS
jgi:hypothetical protein